MRALPTNTLEDQPDFSTWACICFPKLTCLNLDEEVKVLHKAYVSKGTSLVCIKEKVVRARKGKPLRQKWDMMTLKCNGLVEFMHLKKVLVSVWRLLFGKNEVYVEMSWVWRSWRMKRVPFVSRWAWSFLMDERLLVTWHSCKYWIKLDLDMYVCM